MTKKTLILFIILSILLSFSVSIAFAKNSNQDDDDFDNIPERNGVYDVPGRPKLKVRVFVHTPKPPADSSDALVCNLPDPESSALVGATGWKLPQGSWQYNLNVNSVPGSIGASNLPIFADDAFGRWASASANKITFSRGTNTSISRKGFDGKNIIAWGRTSGSALGVTYIWYYPSTGLVAEVDTIMNKKFPWSWTPYAINACINENTYDAQDILTHELGHWLGLDDMYDAVNYQNATMYGYGSKAEIKKDTLTIGDTSGVAAIYP